MKIIFEKLQKASQQTNAHSILRYALPPNAGNQMFQLFGNETYVRYATQFDLDLRKVSEWGCLCPNAGPNEVGRIAKPKT